MTAAEFKDILLPRYRDMYAVAFGIMRNAEDASDAVQETMAALWRKCKDLQLPESPQAFSTQAVRNVCIDKLRASAKRYFETTDELLKISDPVTTDAKASYRSTLRYIKQVLEGFPDKQRQVLTLSFISQLSYDEICRVTGESPPNVRKIISRGRIKIKEIISNESKI